MTALLLKRVNSPVSFLRKLRGCCRGGEGNNFISLCLSLLSATHVFNASRGRILLNHWICWGSCASFERGWRGRGEQHTWAQFTEPLRDSGGLLLDFNPHTPPAFRGTSFLQPFSPGRLYHPRGPIQADQAVSHPSKRYLSPACCPSPAGPTLTFFPKHLSWKERPKEEDPKGELDPAHPQLHAGWRGALIPAPACSPGSGLQASAPAHSAWISPAASWLERAHCTTSLPGPQLWWKIKASGWRSLTAFTCLKGAGHRLPIWQANKPTLKASTFSWEPPSTFAPVLREAPDCHLLGSPRYHPCTWAGPLHGRTAQNLRQKLLSPFLSVIMSLKPLNSVLAVILAVDI